MRFYKKSNGYLISGDLKFRKAGISTKIRLILFEILHRNWDKVTLFCIIEICGGKNLAIEFILFSL